MAVRTAYDTFFRGGKSVPNECLEPKTRWSDPQNTDSRFDQKQSPRRHESRQTAAILSHQKDSFRHNNHNNNNKIKLTQYLIR